MNLLRNLRRARLFNKRKFVLTILITPLLTLIAHPSLAQSDSAIVEEVIVTGSRLVSGNQVSKAPINTIDEEAFILSGNLSISEAINELPQLGESFGSQSQNITSLNDGFNAGTELVNLRNLGSKRTLVLVNGRRHIGGDPGTSSVDLNAIPAGMIDRIDVVTGAASAVYGADAVSGVVNVILKNDYEGFNVSTRYGEATEEGDGEESSVSLTFGNVFDNGRGSFIVSTEVTKTDPIVASDREFGQFDGCRFSVDASCGSSAIPGGRLRKIGLPGDYTFDTTGTPEVWDGSRFNRLPNRYTQVPVERNLFSSVFNYNLFEAGQSSVNFILEGSYSNSEASVQIEPQFFWFRRTTPQLTAGFNQQLVPADNPYMLDAIARVEALTGQAATLNPDGIEVLRRITELGVRTSRSDRDSYRFLAGLEGNISDRWTYELYYQTGQVRASQSDEGTLDKQRFFAGLNIDDNGTPGVFSDDTCRDAAFAALGCTPVDIFGTGSISQDFLDYASIDVISDIESQQDVFSGYISGQAFELPAGMVGLVLGAEYREEFTSVDADEALQDGTAATRALQSIEGGYDVSEVFAEINIPLLADFGMVDSFDIGGAIRFSDYSTVGNETSWSIRSDISFNQVLRLRTTYGTAVRAPNVNELFSPVQSSTTNIVDACDTDGGALTLAGDAATNCAAAVGAGSTTFDQTQIQAQTVRGKTGGNADLGTENADTFSFGAVFTPFNRLAFSADYYNIKLKDAISTFSLQNVVNQCILLGVSDFCAQVERDNSGQIVAVNNALINAASEEVSGVDLQANYGFDVDSGAFDLSLNYSHLLDHTFVAFEGDAEDELAGQVGDFDDRITAQLVYTRNDLTLAWSTRWLSAANADNLLVGTEGNDIDSILYNDIQGSYKFGIGAGRDDQFGITLGVKNLLDEQPPIITQPARTQVSGSNTVVGGVYDTRGRFVYLNLSAAF
jgi:iron complex outermembrane receptor protein